MIGIISDLVAAVFLLTLITEKQPHIAPAGQCSVRETANHFLYLLFTNNVA